ncbi:MAG: SDR family oxidoreductase [Hyphomicrobiaceae bacterium]|nr:SDR family oxidoreductase [Hyphomicrobiaceae bacterium]
MSRDAERADRPVTLVTGVSRGIGMAIAQDLARRGHRVVGMARTPPAAFEGIFVPVDLADPAATAAALEEVTGRHRVLRLVNNAGMVRVAGVEAVSLDDFDALMGVNVRSVMQCIQAVLPAMRAARFGRIVTIGSRAGLGKEGRLVYSTSKAAVLGMTRTVALEYAMEGITANCIAPGPIETDMIRINYPPGSENRAAITRRIPLGRFGTTAEIAHACAYFLSDEAGFTTGQVLYVCGGMSVGQAPI